MQSIKEQVLLGRGVLNHLAVDSEHYLFALYKYIEMNPIKASMVKDIADYEWSSYRHNALGQTDGLSQSINYIKI